MQDLPKTSYKEGEKAIAEKERISLYCKRALPQLLHSVQIVPIMLDRIPLPTLPDPTEEEPEEEVFAPDSDSEESEPEPESPAGQPSDEEEEAGGEADRPVVVLRPSSIYTGCSGCHGTIQLHFLATLDASIVFEQLMLSEKLNFVCDSCHQELNRIHHERIDI